MATILRPPIVSGPQKKPRVGYAFVAANLLTTTLAAAPATLPPGEQLSDSAPRVRKIVTVDQFIPSQDQLAFAYAPISMLDTSSTVIRKPVRPDVYPNLLQNTLGSLPALALPLNAAKLSDSSPPRKRPVYVEPVQNILARGINPNAAIRGLTDSAPILKAKVVRDDYPNLLNTTLAPVPEFGQWSDGISISKRPTIRDDYPNLLATTLAPAPPPPDLDLPLLAIQQHASSPPPKYPVWATQQHNLLAIGINPNPTPLQLSESAPRAARISMPDVFPWSLAQQPVPTTVPDVVGEDQATGTADLEGAGFVVIVTTEYSDTVPAGTIISQVPAGGSEATPGSSVTIVVSLGTAPMAGSNPGGGGGGGGKKLPLDKKLTRIELEALSVLTGKPIEAPEETPEPKLAKPVEYTAEQARELAELLPAAAEANDEALAAADDDEVIGAILDHEARVVAAIAERLEKYLRRYQ